MDVTNLREDCHAAYATRKRVRGVLLQAYPSCSMKIHHTRFKPQRAERASGRTSVVCSL